MSIIVSDELFDGDFGLFYRDKRFLEATTKNGRAEQPVCIDGRLDEQAWKYVSFDVEEPNAWAVVRKQVGFLKVFLDPDGDGKNYLLKKY